MANGRPDSETRMPFPVLIADIGVDSIQQRKVSLFGGNVKSGVSHQGQQPHRF